MHTEDELLTPTKGWQSTNTMHIAPVSPENANLLQRILLWAIERFGKLKAANLWLLMMNNMRLLRGMLGFASKLMPFGELDRRDTELAILRVAWLCRSRYEWGQHVDIGTRAGLTEEEIRRIPEGPNASDWTPKQRLILKACDELISDHIVAEDTWSGLSAEFSVRHQVELLMLIGWYQGLAGVLNSSCIPLDAELEKTLKKYTAR